MAACKITCASLASPSRCWSCFCSGDAVPHDCSLHASDASEADSRSHTRFPLTPTLSLGERERPCARVRRWRGPWFVERWEVVLPLPKGEGWGEGEVRVRPSPCAVEDLCKGQS